MLLRYAVFYYDHDNIPKLALERFETCAAAERCAEGIARVYRAANVIETHGAVSRIVRSFDYSRPTRAEGA